MISLIVTFLAIAYGLTCITYAAHTVRLTKSRGTWSCWAVLPIIVISLIWPACLVLIFFLWVGYGACYLTGAMGDRACTPTDIPDRRAK